MEWDTRIGCRQSIVNFNQYATFHYILNLPIYSSRIVSAIVDACRIRTNVYGIRDFVLEQSLLDGGLRVCCLHQ